jgi:hypothetical protein
LYFLRWLNAYLKINNTAKPALKNLLNSYPVEYKLNL